MTSTPGTQVKRRIINAGRTMMYYRWPFKELTTRLRPRAGILLYHRIAPVTVDPHNITVSPEHFEAQLRLLKRRYTVMGMDDFIERFPQRRYPDRTIVVTFDDGYVDNLTCAFPIAARQGVPFTVFVAAAAIGNPNIFWWDEVGRLVLSASQPQAPLELELDGLAHSFRPAQAAGERLKNYRAIYNVLKHLTLNQREPHLATIRCWAAPDARQISGDLARPMTLPELQEFAALPGVNIGAHSANHLPLETLAPDQQLDEFFGCKRTLEEWLDRPVRTMAYPFGGGNIVSHRMAAWAGYQAAFSTVPVPVTPQASPFALPRLYIHDWPEDEFNKRLRTFFGE